MIQGLRYRRFSGVAWFWALSLVIAPLLYVVIISFMSRGAYGGVVWTMTLDNYLRIAEPDNLAILGASLTRSVGLAFVTTLMCVAVGFPLALFLVFRSGRFRQALFFLLIIPFWTNFLIRTYAWMVLLSDNGWINHLLEKIGFGPQALNWLFTPQAVLIGMFYNYLPYMAMSLYVSVEKLDPKLLDAAADLGAGPLKRFFKVIVPLCGPGLAAGSIMVFIPAMGEFVIPDILGGGTSLFIGNLLAQQFLVVRHWPYGAALSVVLMVLVGVCIALFEKYGNGSKEDLLA
ncbi:MAG: ABC transporter permease [Oligoflexia bacterium]|nr:ABC transporter permease [Oligoflexia bacterium]